MNNYSALHQVKHYLQQIQQKGQNQKRYGSLKRAISKRLNVTEFACDEILEDLHATGDILLPFPKKDGAFVSLNFQLEEDKPVGAESWHKILGERRNQISNEQFDVLYEGNQLLFDLDEIKQKAIFLGLIKLSKDTTESDPYMLSAKHLLGSSKALDKLGKKITSAFLPNIELSPRTQYVLTAGPIEPEAIIIIENMSNFTAFHSSKEVDKALAICSFGYGISTEKIGQRLLDGSLVACPADGPRPNLISLFKTVPCYFWGDLDKAGLDIYLSLKSALPELKISAAYEAMARKLFIPSTCHSYDGLSDKKGQKRPRKTDNESVKFLSNLCEDKAVDQEAICSPWPGDLIWQEFDLNRLKANSYIQSPQDIEP